MNLTNNDQRHQTLTDLSQLVTELGNVGVSGPFHENLDRDSTLIGSGAQFDVYSNPTLKNIVYKRVKLISPASILPKSVGQRLHYRTIQLEIASLCDPVRRTSPNIVRLLGWGFDDSYANRSSLIPVLKVERAIDSLEAVFRNNIIEIAGRKASNIHHHLCLDVASGLQAIHQSSLAHGDLKPSNVLVFAQAYPEVPFITKLSDFGQCIILNTSFSDYRFYRGTTGWVPPEITRDACDRPAIEPQLFVKCDAYTYGMLTMSVFLNGGETLTSHFQDSTELLPAQCCSRIKELGLVEDLSQKLEVLASNELAPTPESRRDVSPNLLRCESESFHEWYVSKLCV